VRKIAFLASAVLAMLILASQTPGISGGTAAAKASASVAHINILSEEDRDYSVVLTSTLKSPGGKDLLIDVSLECGLFTATKVASEAGVLDTSTAKAAVDVKVVIDRGTAAERVALPGEITFCSREQTLSGSYAGIEDCEDQNGDGEVTDDECDLTPEETELLLDTMNANSFNFVLTGVRNGVHRIEVLAKIDTDRSAEAGTASSHAAIGHGTVTVESVRLARDGQLDVA